MKHSIFFLSALLSAGLILLTGCQQNKYENKLIPNDIIIPGAKTSTNNETTVPENTVNNIQAEAGTVTDNGYTLTPGDNTAGSDQDNDTKTTDGIIKNTPPSTKTTSEVNPVASTASEAKTFNITATSWSFSPSSISVNKGDTVIITITSTDVPHGFALPDYNIDENVEPGTPVSVSFVADKVGTFSFHCSVFCGEGHREMEGILEVK